MSNRLPTPGGDQGDWGTILNDFLSVSLYSNAADPSSGALNANTVGAVQIQAGAVTSGLFDNETQSIINSVADRYVKPATGIPSSDMASSVQTSLSLANTAIQPTMTFSGGDLSGTIGSPVVTKLNGLTLPTLSPSNGQVLTANGSGGTTWTTAGAGVTIDPSSSDIQPLGSASAGDKGQAADSGHVHPMPRLDQVGAPTSGVSFNSQKITNLANGSASGDAAAFGQIPVAGTTAGTYAAGNDTRVTGALQASNNLSELSASASTARTNLGLGSAATMSAGGANGLAQLDGTANVEASQLGNVLANLRYRGAWSASSVAYKVNDAVTNNGGFYICINAHTSVSGAPFPGIASGGNWAVLTGRDAYVDDFGGDPTGTYDSTAAFNAALASLPTTTIYQDQGANSPPTAEGSGNSFVEAVGTIIFSAGTYMVNNTAINGGVAMNTTGPYVTVRGKGKFVTTLMDYSPQANSFSCTVTSGQTTISTSGNFITGGIQPYMKVSGTVGGVSITAGTYVLPGGVSTTSLNISQALPGSVSNSSVSLNFNSFVCTANNRNGYNVVSSGGEFYAGTQWSGGSWRDLTFDGYNAGSGANGLLIDSGEDWIIQDVTMQNYTSGFALTLMDSYWIDGWNIRMTSVNNLNAVAFLGQTYAGSSATTPGSANKSSQGNLELHLQANPGQSGLLVTNGAWIYHSRIVIRGGFYLGPSGGKVISVNNANSAIDTCEVVVAVELDSGPFGTAAAPTTIKLDTTNGAKFVNCFGYLAFRSFQGSFNPIDYTGAAENFSFWGMVAGDTTLTDTTGASGRNTLGNPALLQTSTSMY